MFVGGKVYLFHQYNDINKMRAAVKMIFKNSLKSWGFFMKVVTSLRLVGSFGFSLAVCRNVSVPG